ncbi:GntR family transcriptional regulator [Ereboglobus luteus]|uniref:GntR family transcriptional regulator n=1 Tax=Ereboglobus luteus TaxID=1796921 RepID=A0A2U8E5B8_9BACT|nr:substrate-binding domain-containing protein [Ereboglobus luteus]AWI10010.1 GntR family transcriptional regulator [Ereboglobus luteus]
MAALRHQKLPEDTNPKYMRIAAVLREKILSGQYAPGHRLPSESALVKSYGVSRPTAGRALRDLVDAGLVERRAGAGSFVASQPKAVTGRPTLGILMPQWESTEIFEKICGQLASLARAHGIDIAWSKASPPNLSPGARIKDESEQAERMCSDYIERRMAGVFFAPLELSKTQSEVNHRIVSRLTEAGIAIVLADRDIEKYPQRSGFDLASMDNFAAGYKIASHLLLLGCRRIAFFTKPYSASTVAARIAGMREAMARANVETKGEVIEGNPADAKFARSVFARKKWDACICANDRTAAQLLQSLIKLGIRVPGDLRVAGFDDAKYATLVAVPLTTIHQPGDEVAALAFEAMMRRINNPLAPSCAFLATPRLVVRESCGTYLPR